jgi:predicted Rossmann fold flavoprotein
MNTEFDVIVVGGGPAGLMSAGRSAQLGKRVLILEKNEILGKKLLITGGGRCNVTNTNSNLEQIYKIAGKYLKTTFSQFNVENTLEFFHSNGMDTKIENAGRIFPKSNRSQSVLDVLLKYINQGSVTVELNANVLSIEKIDEVFQIEISSGIKYLAKSVIISTGGVSHPETGSTGDGFKWLSKLGHNIIKNDFALVPLALTDEWAKKLSGATLDDVKLSVFCDNVKKFQNKGRILFTHFGLSGPLVLNMSKKIGELLAEGEVTIQIDLFPTVDIGTLRTKLNEILKENSNKVLRNSLSQLFPKSLVPAVLEISNVDGYLFNHSIQREFRHKIVDTIKGIPIHVTSLMGADKAIVSSGGVDINEIDFKTMESKKIPRLYLVGDVIDIDRPSGGYSLQLCWTTGYVAGTHA